MRLLIETRHNGLTVPASVVQQGPQGPYAYVIDPERDSAVLRHVKIAQISDGQALVDSGLKATSKSSLMDNTSCSPERMSRILHGKAAQEAAAQSALQPPIP